LTKIAENQAPGATGPAITTTSIHVDGIDVRCLQAGAGDPLVYLHGAGGLRLSMAHRALAEKHRLIALELPGFGKTAADHAHTSARAIATTMANALKALGISRCILMGHSLGANVALWMTIDNPELVSALVLIAPTAIRPEASPDAPFLPREVAMPNPGNIWFGEPVSTQIETAMRDRARKLSSAIRDPELSQAMAKVATPVLALFGTRSTVVSTDAAREYTALLQKCFATLVYDAGHDIDMERPEAVASVVGNFLQHGESFIVNRDDGMIHP